MKKIDTLELKGGVDVPVKHTSEQYTIGWKDGLRSLLIAVVTPVIDVIIQSLNEGSLTFDWKRIAVTGLSAGLAYLAKNYFTPSEIVIAKKEL